MATMHLNKEEGDDPKADDPINLLTSRRDLATQATISIVLGLFAFLLFCVSSGSYYLFGFRLADKLVPSSFGLDGPPCMPPARSKRMKRINFLNFQIHSSDGCLYSTESPTRRSWPRPGSMPLLYVTCDVGFQKLATYSYSFLHSLKWQSNTSRSSCSSL